ncbi:hypothetical protein HELRODRAFT_169826 [Helobdella robusta]|uniref:Uncharacterized protein n=1 Tax=Helobdella robusta TaxID=6412 RepID=T1F2C8_HELRO|nr:hypothetical protein HELRODRAFT_169826 [Helobdella robusta]ESO08095.1 hypothetical protein HELRODRAFT_169826 [Helobdella robusta]
MGFKIFIEVFIIFNCFSRISSNTHCSWSLVENCLIKFEPYLNDGTEILRNLGEIDVIQVCWLYSYATSCLAPFMEACKNIRNKLGDKLQNFEYACTVDREDDPHWPVMSTISPHELEILRRNELSEERKRYFDSLIKASIAAGITLLMVGVCLAFTIYSKYKIKMDIARQKKLRPVLEIKVLDDQENLISSLMGRVNSKKEELQDQSADK